MSARGFRRMGGQVIAWDGEMDVYGYKRVSSDDQEKEGMSLAVQDKEILRYAADHPAWTFKGMFCDVQTGSNPSRADYQRMLGAVRASITAGRRVGIIVVKQSRFGRDMEELAGAWKRYVKQLGVEFHVTRDGGLARNEMNFLFQGVMVHQELTNISEGVANSFADGREAGWLKPGRPRWGYAWKPWGEGEVKPAGAFNVRPVPHEDEADYVRELFVKRAAGASYRALADWVQALPSAARGGRQLSVSSIKDVLDSPVYVARNGAPGDDVLERPAGKWAPLCDDPTCATIHPCAEGRENAVRIATLKGEYPLTGFLFCEVCGARMSGQIRRGYLRARPGRQDRTDPDRRVYICSSRMAGADDRAARGDKPCYRTIDAGLIESLVIGTFASFLEGFARPELRTEALAAARELDERLRANGNARRLLNARDRRAALVAERVGLTRSLSAGIIGADAYAEALAVVSASIDAEDAEIARFEALEARAMRRTVWSEVETILEQAPYYAVLLETGTSEDKREFLRIVLDHATPERLAPGRYLAGMKLTAMGERLREIGARLMPAAGYTVEDVQLAWANCTVSTGTDADLAAAS